jgi:hypothetical protein
MKKFCVITCLLLLAFVKQTAAQIIIDSTEITSSVPALSDFHRIIYPMWHTAYPAKDMDALKGFVPQIKVSMEKINQAILPGILKDKEVKWKNQLHLLNGAAENYYHAAEGKNDDDLLAAAEKLHEQYEMMFRVVRPVLKEIDEYHQTLYIIYHKLYPDKKYMEIAELMDDLILRADAIVQVPQDRLKKRLGDHTAKFDLASKELYIATVSLKETLQGADLNKKDMAVENMHTLYQQLVSVFQ